MRKATVHRFGVNRRSRPATGGSAFSLIELVVSVGVLALMFLLAGQVFTLTLRSTGQARAVTTLSQTLREFERTVRQDLAEVDPSESLILIQGNPVNAYWTADGRELDPDDNPDPDAPGQDAGYPHVEDPERENASGHLVKPRADILMFFAARETSSYNDPRVSSSLVQVVYNHARLGEYVEDTDGGVGDPEYLFEPTDVSGDGEDDIFPLDEDGEPDPDTVSALPANQWHLARRAVLISPIEAEEVSGVPVWAERLYEQEILDGAMDIVEDFDFEEMVLTPAEEFPFFRPKVLLPDRTPVIPVYERSNLDVTPPALMGRRLGSYFLPNCASFKVEWSLDPRSELVAGRLDGESEVYWIDPGAEDPLASLRAAYNDASGARRARLRSLIQDADLRSDGSSWSLEQRVAGESGGSPDPDWRSPMGPNTIFFAARRERIVEPNKGALVQDDLYPYALRITIDIYDDDQRLERPRRHVVVVPVGR
jgi:type II secretory pathway pseudopilin PulG